MYILMCDSAFGTYYLAHGDEKYINKVKDTLSKFTIGALRVKEFTGDELELQELIEDSTEFIKRYKKESFEGKEGIEEVGESLKESENDDLFNEDDLFEES